ncbi:MAG: hypothetical protein B1H03_01920 [Planctomycetales bacterium 4484_113]|nr:MAG: hypothetical protein B1H03_01920 [Planctomycetales bacterium 4484_113]
MLRLLFNNWQYKLASLLLAVVFSLYIYYFGNYQVQATVSVPLVVQNLASELALSDRVPTDVRLTVSGTPQEVNSLKRSLPRATLDLASLTNPGTYALNPKLPELPNVKLAGFVAPVTVCLERRQERRLKVEISHEGSLAPGYLLSDETIEPKEVTISGPEQAVQRSEHVVGVINLNGRVSNIVQAIPLVVRDKDYAPLLVDSLTVIPSTVHYSAQIKPVADAKVIRVIPVLKGEPEVGYAVSEITIEPSQILLDKKLAASRSISSVSTGEIDLAGRTKSFTVTVALDYPFTPPVDVPRSVRVRVVLRKVESEAANVLNLTISLENRNPDYDYLVRPSLIAVESEDLVDLSAKERSAVRAVVDVATFGVGVYRVTPTVVLPSSVLRLRMRPQTVELSVEPHAASSSADGASQPEPTGGEEG